MNELLIHKTGPLSDVTGQLNELADVYRRLPAWPSPEYLERAGMAVAANLTGEPLSPGERASAV